MNYSIEDISKITGGELITHSDLINCSLLLTDTRTMDASSSKGVFFAINGTNRKGLQFIPEAYGKGVRNFVTDDKEILKQPDETIVKNSNFLFVNDSLEALQRLAAHHRNLFDIHVIGITGSNGKTIVKEWLYQLLYKSKSIHRSPKSYNSQLGVPLSVLGLNKNHDLAIFEAGISRSNEMDHLQKIIKPDTGIFINIGSAHQENFKTIEDKISEKLILFKDAETLIYRKDYVELDQVIREKAEQGWFSKNIRLIDWSAESEACFRLISSTKTKYDSQLTAVYLGTSHSIKINFTDEASIENAIFCWIYLLQNNFTDKEINAMMQHLSAVEMRMELKEGINNCTLINDTYNSDIHSLAIALDFLNQQNQHTSKTLILSDILQSGMDDNSLYSEVSTILKSKGLKKLIGIGSAISRNKSHFPPESRFFESTDAFIESPELLHFDNEAILIKGARSFEFEKITNALQKKVHTTILELNFQSLINNLNVYRSFLKPGTKIMAMVKAFSYGNGSHEIANVLQYHGVDYLAVAYADEGIDLRIKGITMPILVMNPEPDSLRTIFNNNLEPEIFSMSLLNDLIAFSKNHPGFDQLPVHIKLDTGMHRLGFDPTEIDNMLDLIKANPAIKVKSIFTHLAASDCNTDDVFTRTQFVNFKKLSDSVIEKLGYAVWRHILNSTAIVRFPYAQFDMVRLGIGLYGIDSSGTIQDKLENISTFKTSVSQVRAVKGGDSVGYETHAVMNRDSVIAVIGVGYADGFSRGLSNGVGSVMIKGSEVPVVGNVCMDMTLVDVTGLEVHEGDEVILFGRDLPVTVMAEKLNTIPYEILTSVSQRVKRVYFKE